MPQLKHSAKPSPLRWTCAAAAFWASASDGGGRRLERRRAGPGLGDERLAVEQADEAVLADDGERTLERRRQAKRHLSRPVDERGKPPRRVAAVPRVQRTTEAAFDSDVFA